METNLQGGDTVAVNWNLIKTMPEVVCCKIPKDDKLHLYQKGNVISCSSWKYCDETFGRWCIWFFDAGDYMDVEITMKHIPEAALAIIKKTGEF